MQHRPSSRRRWLVAGFWLLAVVVFLGSPLRSLWDREALSSALHAMRSWGPLAFVVLYASSMMLGFPTLLFTVVSGAVFGLLWGTVYSMAGATAGAMGGFGLSRYLLHAWAEQRVGRHPALRRFRQGIADQGLWFVLAVRLVPVTPFNLENYLFGLTALPWRPYLWGTVLGILPGTLAYVWLGVTGAEAMEGGSGASLLAALFVLALLACLALLVRRRLARLEP